MSLGRPMSDKTKAGLAPHQFKVGGPPGNPTGKKGGRDPMLIAIRRRLRRKLGASGKKGREVLAEHDDLRPNDNWADAAAAQLACLAASGNFPSACRELREATSGRAIPQLREVDPGALDDQLAIGAQNEDTVIRELNALISRIRSRSSNAPGDAAGKSGDPGGPGPN